MLEATITAQSVQPQGDIPEEGRRKNPKKTTFEIKSESDVWILIKNFINAFCVQIEAGPTDEVKT